MRAILAIRRTEEGKKIRKQIAKSGGVIHFHCGLQPEPRTDGISNTISTITKDNLLVEIYVSDNTTSRR